MGSDLSTEAIQQGLTTRLIGSNIIYYPTVTSTQDVAREAAIEGAQEGTTIVADEQTKGRARLGRTWINPPGVVAVSIVLYPEMDQLLRLTVMASLATCRCIEKATGLTTSIKWPNDVLINGKKVSGILIESALRGQTVDWAVTGIGINVNFDPEAFPEIASIATSLSAELGREASQLQVLLHLLNEMDQLYMALREGRSIHEEWCNRLETLGKTVEVTFGDHVEIGCAESVEDNGSLLLRRADGTLVSIIAGDVTLHAR